MSSPISKPRYEDSPKLIIGESYFACPLCRRTCVRAGRADGFRIAAMHRHIWACWERRLRAAGLRIGSWNHRRNGYRILGAPPVNTRHSKGKARSAYQKIRDAARRGTGLRLTMEEVQTFGSDDAIITRAQLDDSDDSPAMTPDAPGTSRLGMRFIKK